MKSSIKLKITMWYTCILFAVLLIVLISVYFVSRSYNNHGIKIELMDETADMVEILGDAMEEHPGDDIVTAFEEEGWPSFYDENVILSLYTPEGEKIAGLMPEGFPKDYPFQEDTFRKWKGARDNWLLYDYVYDYAEGRSVWIRSFGAYGSWNGLLRQILRLFAIAFPVLIAFAAWMGYRMLSRALRPIYSISDTASEIALSADLGKRIPESETKDEFYYLTGTFNRMLEELEEVFEVEKQFTSDAAHELRTPIAVILAHCEYCLDELPMAEEMETEIRIIHDKTQRIRKLVEQLLAITRTENRKIRLEREEIDLPLLAESVMEELEERAQKKRIALHLEDRTDHTMLRGDMTLLLRMLLNLVDNAISYGKEDGFVKIYMETVGESMCIGVEDDGIGIPEDELDKIWNRFYRVDKSRSGEGGFGLGLYMVRWIVDMHGGEITVASTVGEGTVFEVFLPMKGEDLQER